VKPVPVSCRVSSAGLVLVQPVDWRIPHRPEGLGRVVMLLNDLHMTQIKTALVIGGGAGPVTALALQKAGIEATVYEAYSTTAEGLGGIFMVAPNGLDALRIGGVDEAVRAISQPIGRML
jgi:hypothetical protein